jgi:hypothetical protein
MFELDGLSDRKAWGALPCALRAWQRWLFAAAFALDLFGPRVKHRDVSLT